MNALASRRLATSALSVLLAVLLGAGGCGPSGSPTDAASPTSLAEAVTIHRDAHGVPHVVGETPAAAAFGFAYAQAEDDFRQVEDDFVRAIGRAAEVHGRDALFDDWLNRALEIPRFSREEYEQAGPEIRALLDGFAAGLNHYVATHPEVEPRLLERFEPWHPLAFIRYVYYQNGFRHAAGLPRAAYLAEFERSTGLDPEDLELTRRDAPSDRPASVTGTSSSMAAGPEAGSSHGTSSRAARRAALENRALGSNSWAVAPDRTASGDALLFVNPHLPFFGPSRVYEGHVMSRDGWNFSGYTRLGFPLPYIGFGESLGWMSTDNYADQTDVWRETFDDPDEPSAYRYGDGHREASQWTDTLRVATERRMELHAARFRKTHHGPVLAVQDGHPMAVRMARFEEPGWLEQWYRMTRAGTFEEFRSVTAELDVLFGNILYADTAGTIYYVYNAAVPVRSEAFDWSAPVDGSDPDAEWRGYHTVDELPQVLNPASGWIQNCNSTPFLSTEGPGNPDPDDFPGYMVVEGDSPRSREARRILSGQDAWTFEAWADSSYSTHVGLAEEEIPEIVRSWEALRDRNPERAESIRPAVELLADWNRVSTVDSEATTLFVHWGEVFLGRGRAGEAALARGESDRQRSTARVEALEDAISRLEETRGSWRVPWGEVNRLQRNPGGGPLAPGAGPADLFDDDRPSLPVPGVPSWAGASFTFNTVSPGTGRRYGVSGNSYVAVVEFGDTIRAGTLHTFGASGEPDSPHYFDQAPLFVQGDYKAAPVTMAEVEEAAVRSYRPRSP
ncbi:MAG: penicillin acylase family protein [Gemmatimonadota bacterium]